MLYLDPEKGVDLAKSTVAYRSRNLAFDVEKADYVEIAGIEFFATTFRFERCNHCLVEDFGDKVARRGIGKTYLPPANAAWFADAAGLDFRPAAKSPLLGAGKPAEGDSPVLADTKTGTVPDAGAYQRNEPYWIPGATWVDADIGLPAVVVDVARRAAAQPKVIDARR